MRKFVTSDRNSPFRYVTAELVDPITIEVAVGQRVRGRTTPFNVFPGGEDTRECHLDAAAARKLATFLNELADQAEATAARVTSPA